MLYVTLGSSWGGVSATVKPANTVNVRARTRERDGAKKRAAAAEKRRKTHTYTWRERDAKTHTFTCEETRVHFLESKEYNYNNLRHAKGHPYELPWHTGVHVRVVVTVAYRGTRTCRSNLGLHHAGAAFLRGAPGRWARVAAPTGGVVIENAA